MEAAAEAGLGSGGVALEAGGDISGEPLRGEQRRSGRPTQGREGPRGLRPLLPLQSQSGRLDPAATKARSESCNSQLAG